jgi:hypothetical protein
MLLALIPLGAAQAQVAVTSANPAEAPQGTISLDVTINGSGFDSTAQVTFLVTGTTNPGGITVKKVAVRGSKKLVATIDIADTAIVDKFDIEVALTSGRKGKGASLFAVQPKINNDPCAALNLDFPAFTYRVQSAKGQQIYVADATGKCSRPVYEIAGSPGDGASAVFSYPVAGTTDVGRVVWQIGIRLIYGITFTVTGTSVAPDAVELIYDSGLNQVSAIDLSKDGITVYADLVALGPTYSAKIIAINISDHSQRDVYVGPPDSSNLDSITVNEDGVLFVRHTSALPDVPHQFLRIGPNCADQSCATVIVPESLYGLSEVNYLVASLVDDRVVYSHLLPGFANCWLLQIISDTGGPILNSAQPRYGRRSSWYDGKILTNGSKSPTGSGLCNFTGMITQIDPATSADTALVRGYDPDGR